nr:integrase, catalytic region, zinc finger, CCHC-type, peptidase aspartic, catalytic [Tanacetum cinerariifolium]
MDHQISYAPPISYNSPKSSTQPMIEFPQMDSRLVVPVFNQGDDPIACLNKAMAFLTVTEDLDAYDSDCDDVSNAKATLMANLSNYGSGVISEAPKELLKVSLVNTSLKKLRYHHGQFDTMVKKRITPDVITKGECGFKHTKAVFLKEIILFLKTLKDIFDVFEKDLLNEDVLLYVMNSTTLNGESVNLDSNTHVLPSTRLKSSTSASRSQPLDSGCSKHMTENRSQLMNFVSKFMGTVRFENDQIAKIMWYGDYQLGNVTVSRVGSIFRRTSLTGFPAQSIRSSNAIALDSPYLLVLVTRTSQSRQHESRKPPTTELFDVDSGRISIHHCEY